MNVPLATNLPGPGTLALVGSGEYLPPMDPVDRYLLGLLNGPARVICLPTAAGTEGDERVNYWCRLGEEHFQSLKVEQVRSLKVVDRASAMDDTMAEHIAQANFVYLSGGKPHYLYSTLEGTPVFDAIRGVLEQGGVVAGCSAGAMIFGQSIPGSPLPWSWGSGFAYLSEAIILPHFDELPQVMLAGFLPFANKLNIVGIDGNTALVCRPDGCSVHGKGGVTLIRGGDRGKYTEKGG